MLTIPRSIYKSSTKDLSFAIFRNCDVAARRASLMRTANTASYDVGPKPIDIRVTSQKVNIVAFQHGF